MGWIQLITASLECPRCRREGRAVIDLRAPWADWDAPDDLVEGDALGLGVSSYDMFLCQLRTRANPESGRAIAEWTCPHCVEPRWALLTVEERDGVASLTAVEACPIAATSVARADWIDANVAWLVLCDRELPESTRSDGVFDAAQLRVLCEMADSGAWRRYHGYEGT